MNAPMTAPRVPEHPVADQFLSRWSPRAFAADTMAEAEVLSLLEAARWAPSAMNEQPWRFAYGLRGEAEFAAIAEALVPFNRVWAEKAAALIVIASKTTATRDGAEVPFATHAFDTGAAWASLALQAHLNGWAAHAMGGFDHAIAARNLNLPENHALHAIVAVGRRGDASQLPEALQARETQSPRKPLVQIARKGGF